jgi:hypothetical protein
MLRRFRSGPNGFYQHLFHGFSTAQQAAACRIFDRMKLLPAILAGLVVLAGCAERVISGGDGPHAIAFELVYPQPGAGQYFAVSGVRLVTDEVVRDTVVKVTGRTFFGQFFTAPGVALPSSVELNGVAFERHLQTDTLRLGGTDNATLFGVQTWRVTDNATPATYQVQTLQEIDSVAPLWYGDPIRGDTALVLTWTPPTGAGGGNGVLITWRMPGVETYSERVIDIGRFTIPASVVARFPGDSEIILSRYRTEQNQYKGGVLYLTRVAQRNYKVTVFG